MSNLALGNPVVAYSYQYDAKGSAFNKLFYNILAPGVYNGGGLSFSGNQILVGAYDALFPYAASKQLVSVHTSSSINLSSSVGSGGYGLGDIGTSLPYIAAYFIWADGTGVYPDYGFYDASILGNSSYLILGKATFTGASVSGFDYSSATYPPTYNSTSKGFNIRGLVDSTSSSTGSMVVNGGVGIAKSLCIGTSSINVEDSLPPIGSIISYAPGYFTSSANAGYTSAGLTLSSRWKVCDGSALNDSESPIFNRSGRYLPNLTDSRFLMGSNSPGGIGGQNSFSISASNLPPHTHIISHDHGEHTHTGTTGGMNANADHSHGFSNLQGIAAGGGSGPIVSDGTIQNPKRTDNTNTDHTHTFTSNSTTISYSGSSGNGGFSNSAIENRPLYLSCKYIIRIK